jgi:hypothetical protein
VRLQWDPRRGTPDVKIFIKTTSDDIDDRNTEALGLQIIADFPVDALVDRSVEDGGDEIFKSSFYRLFSYDFRFPGRLGFKPRDAGTSSGDGPSIRLGDKPTMGRLPWRHTELYQPEASREFGVRRPLKPPTAAELDPIKDAPRPKTDPEQRQEEKRQDTIRGQPSFATQAEMEAYIKDHPKDSFIGITTSTGQFVARKVDEDELHRLAEAQREDPDNLAEYGWDAKTRRSAWGVAGIYQNGRRIDVDTFAQTYYDNPGFAAVGSGDSLEEAEVYRTGAYFGRRQLDHDQALARWAELDAMSLDQVLRLETEPGHRFVSLLVRGVGRMHELGESYFRGREAFRATIVKNAAAGLEEPNLFNEIAPSEDIRAYLLAETDREHSSPALLSDLAAHDELAEAVSLLVYDQVETRGQNLAMQRISAGADSLRPYGEDPDRMRAFVFGFPQMNAGQREDAMTFIGVPKDERPYVLAALSDNQRAQSVALGLDDIVAEERTEVLPVDPPVTTDYTVDHKVSLEILMGWARETVKGLDDAVEQLFRDDVKAIWLEGELGEAIRTKVYDEFGFRTLDPKKFPHRDESSGWWPEPLRSGPHPFASLAEQMYANRVHGEANTARLIRVLEITVLVAATVLLILVAQGAGAVAAGLLFAEGSAGFVATELVVSGVVFTALNEAKTRALEGRSEIETAGDFVGHSLVNIATFGAFRFLNTLLAAVGEEVFAGSRGAQQALRFGASGATFLITGIVQRLAAGQSFKSGEDFGLFIYENLLTLAALEGGAVASRSLMEGGSMWARANRLGAFEPEITALRGDVARLEREIVSVTLRPQAAARDAPPLAERTKQVLQTQRALAERLRERFRTRSDATALEREAGQEIERIDAALAGIRRAEFLTAEHVVPVADSESVFSYRGGAEAADRFKQYYGADKVQVADDGTIRVDVPGLETRELVFVPEASVQGAAGSAGKTPPIVSRQQALEARQKALLSRAKRLGYTDASLDAIRRLRPLTQTETATLDATEQRIAKAEADAGGPMSRLTANILKNVIDRLGADAIQQIRAGELGGMSDADLADVLWAARGLKSMGVAQLRGLAFAAQAGEPPIDIAKLLKRARSRSFRVADRNFALETFVHMTELKVAGARQMMADMSVSNGKFRGGLFQMEVIRFVGGVEQVASIEAPVEIGARVREYDITLRDGTRIECKDWASWEHAAGLADQFERDMRSLTKDFADPGGLRRMRYYFRLVRGQPPRPVAEIRAFLRARLVSAMEKDGVATPTAEAMLKVFDDFTDLVQAPDLQRTGGKPLDPIEPSTPSPALLRRHDDDDAGDDGGDDGGE